MNREHLRRQLIRHEGLALKPYRDTTGHLTIGVGRNLTDQGLTHEEAMALLDHDLVRVEREVRTAIPWFFELDDVRQGVLCNMAFNLGITKLLEFHETLTAIHRRDYMAAAAHMLDSYWARQVGHRAVELAEAMRDGGPVTIA